MTKKNKKQKINLQEYLLQQKNKVDYLWKNPNYQINGPWLRGFIEAEGSFIKDNTNNKPLFEFSQHKSDLLLLKAIQTFFQCGSIHDDEETSVYRISEIENIENKVIPLITKSFVFSDKKRSYENWLNKYFPDNQAPVETSFEDSFDFDWLQGFTDGDGSFFLRIDPAKDRLRNGKVEKQSKTGYQVRLIFDLAQKNSKEQFRTLGRKLFPEKNKKGKDAFELLYNQQDQMAHLRVSSLKVLQKNVRPLFCDQSLQSRKRLNWILWSAVLYLMDNKLHLTDDGLKGIREFKTLIDFYRTNSPPIVIL